MQLKKYGLVPVLLILCQLALFSSCASRIEDWNKILAENLKREPSRSQMTSDFMKYLLMEDIATGDGLPTTLDGCAFSVYEHDSCLRTPQGHEGRIMSLAKVMRKKERNMPDYLDVVSAPMRNRFKRNALKCEKWLWPEGIVPYRIQIEDAIISHQFYAAVEELESLSCVAFKQVDHTNKLNGKRVKTLNIIESRPIPGERCRASVGSVGLKPTLQLSTVCTKGHILHELMHVLGFAHEHTRPDRDKYIQVDCENMMSNMTSDFRRLKPSVVTSYGEEYDFNSIMHYKLDHFSKNGKDTIHPLVHVDRNKVGEMKRLSKADVRKLNKLYNCF